MPATLRPARGGVNSGCLDNSAGLHALGQALQRVHGAGHGLCVDCGCTIPLGRLRLAPQALRRAVCQARLSRPPPPEPLARRGRRQGVTAQRIRPAPTHLAQ